MKKLAIIFAISGLLFASCGNKAKQNQEATHSHTHADGGSCSHDHGTAAKQESFDVSDSTHNCAKDSTKHQCEGNHDHNHDHNHKH